LQDLFLSLKQKEEKEEVVVVADGLGADTVLSC